MATDSERTKILEMIEEGTITAEQGLTLLKALGESDLSIEEEDIEDEFPDEFPDDFPDDFPEATPELPEPEAPVEPPELEEEIPNPFQPAEDYYFDEEPEVFDAGVEVVPAPARPPSTEEIEKWKRWWVIPLWIGAAITVLGGAFMYWAYSASGFGFWFACAWFPFLLGVAVLALAWGSRTSPWLHVRVQQAPGETPQRIAISFPLPIGLTVWGFRMFGHRIPNLQGVNIEEIILALKDVARDGTPLFVDVDEGENGEKVQVFIG